MPTFPAPVTKPGQDATRQEWHAVSLDELWQYWREDDVGTLWSVRYEPTGQCRVNTFPDLQEAQRATAGWLPADLRWEALTRVVDDHETDETGRAEAQRWLAVWLRDALAAGKPIEQAAICRCGGQLVDVGLRGGLLRTHLDACERCWPPGTSELVAADGCEHHFCGTPAAA